MEKNETTSMTQPVETWYGPGRSDALPPHLKQSNVQTMLVKYENWKCTKAEVTDADSQALVYTIDYKLRKPHLRFFAAGGDTTSPFGSATFHLYTFRIDVDLRGQALKLKHAGLMKSDYTYVSPAFQNQTMKWTSKSGWKTWDYVCLDEHMLPVARFTADASWSNKIGKLEFLGTTGDGEAAKEEILVTGLTLAYYMSIILASVIVV